MLAFPAFVIHQVYFAKKGIKNWAGRICGTAALLSGAYRLIFLDFYFDYFVKKPIVESFKLIDQKGSVSMICDSPIITTAVDIISYVYANSRKQIEVGSYLSSLLDESPVFLLAVLSIVIIATAIYSYLEIEEKDKTKQKFLIGASILLNAVVLLGILMSYQSIFAEGFSLSGLFKAFPLSKCVFGKFYNSLIIFSYAFMFSALSML